MHAMAAYKIKCLYKKTLTGIHHEDRAGVRKGIE
jgi:hypothetical protein